MSEIADDDGPGEFRLYNCSSMSKYQTGYL